MVVNVMPTVLEFLSTDELLRTVLSLYMPTEDLPLPTLEEVLFCDSKTTSEEVRLLVYKQARTLCMPRAAWMYYR